MALSNSQYQEIMREYQAQQLKNKHAQDARIKEIYEKLPSVWELDQEVSTRALLRGRELLGGDASAQGRLREEIADLREQKAILLASRGYPADYMEMHYRCADCEDTGYTKKGKKCHCFLRRQIRLLYAQSNIQNMIGQENFSTLSYDYYEDSDLKRFEAAVNLSRDFIRTFGEDYCNLFFYGTVGTGKSFLSGCIARELLQSGHSVIYFSASGLFDTLARYSFDFKAREALEDFYEDFYNCDLLIIDDLGTEITNSFVTSRLFSCLNERHLRNKATLISTNLSLAELRDRYSDRIFSRITSSFTLCKLTGPDIRILKKRMANSSAL